MKNQFKIHESTLLALLILCTTLITNIVVLFINAQPSTTATIDAYRKVILPLNIIDLLKIIAIVWMGFTLFKIIRNVTNNKKWDERYYATIRRVGWVSILLLLLESASMVGRDINLYRNESLTDKIASESFYKDIITKALLSSPIEWFLILIIFLLADLLHYTNKIKNENESFI